MTSILFLANDEYIDFVVRKINPIDSMVRCKLCASDEDMLGDLQHEKYDHIILESEQLPTNAITFLKKIRTENTLATIALLVVRFSTLDVHEKFLKDKNIIVIKKPLKFKLTINQLFKKLNIHLF